MKEEESEEEEKKQAQCCYTRWPIGVIGGSSVIAGRKVVIEPVLGIMVHNSGSGGTNPLPATPFACFW